MGRGETRAGGEIWAEMWAGVRYGRSEIWAGGEIRAGGEIWAG